MVTHKAAEGDEKNHTQVLMVGIYIGTTFLVIQQYALRDLKMFIMSHQ